MHNKDDGTNEMVQLLRTFSGRGGIRVDKLDPLSSNLIVFHFHQGLALIFALLRRALQPGAGQGSGDLLDYEQYRLVYQLSLKSIAVLVQCIMIFIPVAYIIETLYKKNSSLFKTLLTLVCLTACVFYY